MLYAVQKSVPCIKCGREAKRHSKSPKTIHTEKGTCTLVVSKHYCVSCRKYFTNPEAEKYAPLYRRVSWGLIKKALRLSDSMSLEDACHALRQETGYRLSPTTLYDWKTESKDLLAKMPEELLEPEEAGKEM